MRAIFAIFYFASTAAMTAQTISFYSTMRAGRNAGADWELGVGPSSDASNSTQDFRYLGFPGNNHWGSEATLHNFRIGWTSATNTASVRVDDFDGSPVTASYTYAGPQLPANSVWTLPANSFFVSAARVAAPSSIELQNLSFSSGVQVLSGALPSSISAVQNGNSAFVTLNSPIVLNAANGGGDWFIAGQIRFTGLQSQGGLARNSQLQFMLNATGSAVPEPGSWALIGLGLVALAGFGRKLRTEKSA